MEEELTFAQESHDFQLKQKMQWRLLFQKAEKEMGEEFYTLALPSCNICRNSILVMHIQDKSKVKLPLQTATVKLCLKRQKYVANFSKIFSTESSTYLIRALG